MARARTLWEEGTEPGRQVVVLGIAVTLTLVAINRTMSPQLGWFFDLGFVALCLAAALLVRPQDFFTVGVLPPLLMVGVFWLLAMLAPGMIAHTDDGAFQSVLTGLTSHSQALTIGYVLALACLAIRHKVITQTSKRSGSPAPRRMTSGVPSE